jgi:ubiquinone/menaquinone biosynthesis C-methylase UbiE
MENHLGFEWTGERYVPSIHGNIELEHKHRYFIAQQFAKGKTVLDIASGEGYGTALLSQVADQVIGVDIDQTAVAHATKKYKGKKINFVVGSCSNIPLINCSVDLVVSFETIEHDDLHDQMIEEIARVLKPGGVLLLSSPNRKEYSDIPHFKNPYHKKELYYDELSILISRYFKKVLIYGQRIIYGSLIAPTDSNTRTTFHTFRKCSSGFNCKNGIERPIYFIVIATKEDKIPPFLGSSLLEEDISHSEAILQNEDCQAVQRDTILQLEQKLEEIQQSQVGIRNTIFQLEASRSFRITKPLRDLKRFFDRWRHLSPLIPLLTLLRLLTPANFAKFFAYLKKYGVRSCLARCLFLLSTALGYRRPAAYLTFQPPAHKTRNGLGPMTRKVPGGALPLQAGEAGLRLKLDGIKGELAKNLRRERKSHDRSIYFHHNRQL